jgi:AcrR family transcriptional regulator
LARKPTSKAARQTRESWITAAFETLVKAGIEQVRIERIARTLGITKGSFYYHFKDRTELLDGVLDYWANEMTETVLVHARMFRGDPIERIYDTAEEIIGKEKAGFDPPVRAWARHDPRAQRAVDQIDKIRLNFLIGLFSDAGFDADEAEIRARLMYYYIVGEHFISNKESRARRLEKLQRKVDLLTQATPRSGRHGGRRSGRAGVAARSTNVR